MLTLTNPAPLIDSAWEAFHKRDWDEACRRWERVRQHFPNLLIGYSAAVTTLREARRFDEAEAAAASMLAGFPDDANAHAEHAWLVLAQGKVPEAIALWSAIGERFPNAWIPYFGGARALKEAGNHTAAEALLKTGTESFPNEPVLATEYAAAAANRHAWEEAATRWAEIRVRFPRQISAYTAGAQALRSLRRFDEADTLLQSAAAAFPDDSAPLTEAAWLAHIRRDFAESARRWEQVRTRFPDLISGYTDSLHPLRELKRIADAEQILTEAALRFPNDFGPPSALASLALHRRDWAYADRLYAVLRSRFPDRTGSYSGGILALRELRRHDEAEAVAAQAVARFPNDANLRIDLAWLAQSARDWNTAIERWAAIRATTPGFQDAYIQASRALRNAWRHDEAETLLAEAIRRFPEAAEPAAEHAWIAHSQNRFDEAADRFASLRQRFPATPDGWQGGIAVKRAQFQLPDAEALLQDAMRRFPDMPQFALEHAQLPIVPHFADEKDWPETLRRLDHLITTFPAFESGLLTAVRLLKQAGQPDKAEAVSQSATERLPGSYALAIQFAEAAEERQDWPEAVARYTYAKTRFPDQPGGDIGLARALAFQDRYAEAEDMLQATMARFPGDPAPFAAYADLAMRQENWAAGLTRWTDAQRRFPHQQDFAHRIHEAETRLTEGDPAASAAIMRLVAAPMPASSDPKVSELAMQFESLGGTGLGCEFGIFQRDCGAEPLGLLRWADMPYDRLLATLRNRFEGVGTKEHTELFVSAVSGGRGEYCTRDLRGMMFMRAFIYEDQMPFEKMEKSAFNRLRFLTRKLIDDLETGNKIFVFRVTKQDLTPREIDDLHAAMRAYGDNTLLYVRYEDAAHPNGTVEAVKPGLLIGYIDRFKLSRDGHLSAAPPTASWLTVCRNAYALWRAA